jgi:hypothetical protein
MIPTASIESFSRPNRQFAQGTRLVSKRMASSLGWGIGQPRRPQTDGEARFQPLAGRDGLPAPLLPRRSGRHRRIHPKNPRRRAGVGGCRGPRLRREDQRRSVADEVPSRCGRISTSSRPKT